MPLDAAIYWAEIPQAMKVMASACTASGFAATPGTPVAAGVVGTAKTSVTSGDTLTCTITPTTNEVGLTWFVTPTSTGTFTVSLNSGSGAVLQTNTCTGTTTFDSFGCNGQAVAGNTIFRQEFPVNTTSPVTVLITNTAASGAGAPTTIVDVDSPPATSQGLPPFLMSGVLRQNLDALSTVTAAYDAADAAVVAQAQADNLNVAFANVRGGGAGPGVNTTVDMAASTVACPSISGNTPLHPNTYCGYSDYAASMENAAKAAGWDLFFPGLGGRNLQWMGPLSTITKSGLPGLQSSWNNNLGQLVPSGSLWSPLYLSYMNTSGGFNGSGLLWDASHSTFANGLTGTFASIIQHCASYAVAPSACITDAYFDTVGNEVLLGSITAASLATTQTPTATTTASDHSIPIVLNGVTYYVRLSATP
jgi:hypothetical protein